MSMSSVTWYGAVGGYLGMWILMMVPMMLPSLIPMLVRYRQSMHGTVGIELHGLTALAVLGYFGVWAALGLVSYGAELGLHLLKPHAAGRWLPAAAGLLLLALGAVQFTGWKARQLARCRREPACSVPGASTTLGALRRGLDLGIECSRCCGNLMLVLLAIGMTNPLAIVAITVAISAERLAPSPIRVARVAGVGVLVVGLLMMLRG
ncbi:MAG TPA: DUF2182 domain-containing protein [Gemmatimonadales bacterium]|nr:DUF2182 domain-containing protein [Gemmatimonadales bacterium]